jgi:aryl-alcohol dehydrogenase-like predicted oxidoreductase
MLDYLRSKAIPLTAYAPLAQGRAANDPTLAAIGRKHGATAPQVAIAWLLDQEDVIAIPRPVARKARRLISRRSPLHSTTKTALRLLPCQRISASPGRHLHRNGMLSCEGPLLEWTFDFQGWQPSKFGGRLRFFL